MSKLIDQFNLSRSKERYKKYFDDPKVRSFFNLTGSDKAAQIYETVLSAIDKQRNELLNGGLPNATPLSETAAFIYSLDTISKSHFDMALFDYAGELVEAESKISDNLLKFMGQMSAFMVLIEIPDSDPESQKAAAIEITNLQEFFKAIETKSAGDARFNLPIALLLTKFDKIAEIDNEKYESDPEEYLEQQLSEYLKSPRGKPLKSLINSIEAASEKDKFKIFPISALGSYKAGIPVIVPLKSINILEPFVWAAGKHYEKLLAETDKSLNEKNIVKLLSNCLINDYSSRLKLLADVLPDDSEAQKKSIELRPKAVSLRGKATISVIVLFFVCCFGLEFVFDSAGIAIIKNKEATLADVPEKLAWLEDYSASGLHRHSAASLLLLSKESAGSLAKELADKHDDLFWENIKQDPSPEEQVIKSEAYLKKFPIARHAEEVKKLIEDIDLQKQKAVWVSAASGVEKKIELSLKTGKSITEELFKELTESILILKKNCKADYDCGQRLEQIIKNFEPLANARNQEIISQKKTEIHSLFSDDSDPDSWLKALSLTLALKENISLKPEDWTEFVDKIVLQKLYENYDRYITNHEDDSDELIGILETAKAHPGLSDLLELTGNQSASGWFEDHIQKVRVNSIERKMFEIKNQLSLSSARDLGNVLSKKKNYLDNLSLLIKQIESLGNSNAKLFAELTDLKDLLEKLAKIDQPKTVTLRVTRIEWPYEHLATTADERRCQITVYGQTMSNMLPSKAKTMDDKNDNIKKLSMTFDIAPGQNTETEINAALTDESTFHTLNFYGKARKENNDLLFGTEIILDVETTSNSEKGKIILVTDKSHDLL